MNHSQPYLNRRPIIGLLVMNLADSRDNKVWQGVVETARRHDINLITFAAGNLFDKSAFFQEPRRVLCELIPHTRLDGLIIFQWWGNQAWSEEVCGAFRTVPMVTIMRQIVDCPVVTTDRYHGMLDLMQHLLDGHGYRRIAYLPQPGGPLTEESQHERMRGYRDALAAAGVPIDERLVTPLGIPDMVPDIGDEKAGRAMMQVLLDERRLRPGHDLEAVVTYSDKIALGALQVLQERGIRVPEEIAVVGIDNLVKTRIASPPLTTMENVWREMGQTAVELLMGKLAGEVVPEHVRLPQKLIVRRSCGCLEPMVESAGGETSEISTEDGTSRHMQLVATLTKHLRGQIERPTVWAERLLEEAIGAARKDPKGTNASEKLLTEMREVLYEAAHNGADVQTIGQNLLTELRHGFNGRLLANKDSRDRVENLWHQGRALVGEIVRWVEQRTQVEVEQREELLRDLGQRLINTFNLSNLLEILTDGLSRQGIQGGWLSLYEDPTCPTELARLIMAYTSHEQDSPDIGDRLFPASQFVPPDLLPSDRIYSLIVEPLFFDQEQLGLMVFEAEVSEGRVCEILRGEISSAVHSALLFQRVKDHAAEIARQKYVLDTFMATTPDRIYFKDQKGQIIRANQAHARWMGFDNPEEEIGKTDFDFFSEAQAQVKYAQEQQIIRTGQPLVDIEETDGKGRWLLTTKMPLCDEEEKIVGTFGVSRDITELKKTSVRIQQEIAERRRAETQLRESEELYRTLFERLQDVFFQVNKEGIVMLISPSITHFVGYQPTEVIGSRISERLCASPEQWQQIIAKLEQDGRVEQFELLFTCHNGALAWGSLTAQWYTDRAGKIFGVEGMIRDITATKQLEQEHEHLRQENLTFKTTLTERYKLGEIIGKSPAMQQIYNLIIRAAASDVNVLISGDSGTGKELIAQTIRQLSTRKNQVYVPVNCASIPETLFEREFFGHRKGTFTGATHDKSGFFDQAHHGILFLDEITELTPVTQAKLLRVLQDGSYTPLGSPTPKQANVLIIAATNKDCYAELASGKLRNDFFYRISTIEIHVPPLRDRKEDLPLLIEHILEQYRQKQAELTGKSPDDLPVEQTDLPAELVQALYAHHWPGNIRELQNVLQRYLVTQDVKGTFSMLGRALPAGSLPELTTDYSNLTLSKTVETVEKRVIAEALTQNHYHISKTAAKLGISRVTLHRKLKKYGLTAKNRTEN